MPATWKLQDIVHPLSGASAVEVKLFVESFPAPSRKGRVVNGYTTKGLHGNFLEEDDLGLGVSNTVKNKKPRAPNPEEMVVFGDSISDRRRRFDAPANFDFEDIDVFPWKEVFAANDTEDMVDAYIRGSVTNGKAWAEWLGVDKELNFATASASMTESFRSLETCTGYTGEGEDFPTGTFDEQIDLYLHDVVSKTSSTLGYTHVIILGANDIIHLLAAVTRYAIGLALEESGALDEPYEDPVPFENVFEIVDSVPQLTLDPLLTDLSTALSDGVARLLEAGVTGRILVGNVVSVRGIPNDPEQVDFVDSVILTVNEEISAVVESNDQLRLLDIYTTFASIVDDPDVWTELGFVAPEDEEIGEALPFGTPCFQSNFAVDYTAEIMATQALRASGCQDGCALCMDDTSPCQSCYIGNPSATVCDNPDTRFFWDSVHPTTAVHSLLAQAIRECSGEKPNYDQPIVEMLCPGVG